MKKPILASLALAAAVSLGACNSPQQSQNTATGALVGAGTGAVIGGLATGRASGALTGAGIGAVAGGLLGAASTPPGPGYYPPRRRCAEFYYDYYGNRVCRAYY